MAIEGVDYSFSRPSPAGLYAAGKRFAARYLFGTTAGKAVTRSEVAALHDAGLAVVLIWEWNAAEAKGGYPAGQDRARRAADCVRALGAPATAAVYFAVDYDATELAPVREYFRGVRSTWPHGRTGIYGGRRVIQAAKDGGWCQWLWQTYAWSGGVWVSGTHLQQYRNGVIVAGGDCDLNRAMTAQYGQWSAEGDDMPTANEIAKAVWDIDYVPSYNKDNPTWQSKTVLGYSMDLGRQNRAAIAALRAEVAQALGRPVTDSAEIVQGVLAGLDPATIATAVAAALPATQAHQVVDELVSRLSQS